MTNRMLRAILAIAVSSIAGLCPILGGCGAGTRGVVMSAIERDDVEGALLAYERLRATDGPDSSVLARIAERVLRSEAASAPAAIAELAMAGTAGEPALRELAREQGPGALLALEVLARRSDESARRHLRGLADSSDPEERAASVMGMMIDGDRDALLDAITWPIVKARQHAAALLGGLAPDGEVRDVLVEVSRSDPDASVRAAAVRALGSYGGLAFDALRERLSDAAGTVRMAAVEALIRADSERARAALGTLFETPTSVQGIEAARLLVGPSGDPRTLDEGAQSYLRQALVARDPTLRAQAGVALSSAPSARELAPALREALMRESDPTATLVIARAILRVENADVAARQALHQLIESDTSMNGLQAAIALVEVGDHDAIAALRIFVGAQDSMLRRTAARALARDASRPDEVRSLLIDPDASVRISAAGGILAASLLEE